MLSAVVPLVVLAAAATYEVGLRTEARGSPDFGSDLQLNPTLSVKVPLGHVSLLASYTPRILMFEPHQAKKVSLLHRGRAAAEWRVDRGTQLSLDQQVAYGDNTFSWLAIAAEGGQALFDRLLELQTLRYFGETTAVGLAQALSRRLALNATASYSVSGGIGSEARASLPLQHGSRLSLNLAWLLGAYDSLLATATASEQRFSNGARSDIVDLYGGWRHKLSQRTQFDLSLGAGWGRDVGTGTPNARIYPFGQAGLRRELSSKRNHDWGGILRVGMVPAADPLSGSVYGRVQGSANLDYFPVAKLDLAAGGGAAVGFTGPLNGQWLGFGGASASYELSKHFALSTGARFVALPHVQWVGFLAITVADTGRLAPGWEL